MKIRVTFVIVSILAAAFAALVCVNYRREMRVTRTRISSGSQVVNTPCGMLEYADVGSGMKTILATPPADFKNAIPEEQERVLEVLREAMPARSWPDSSACMRPRLKPEAEEYPDPFTLQYVAGHDNIKTRMRSVHPRERRPLRNCLCGSGIWSGRRGV